MNVAGADNESFPPDRIKLVLFVSNIENTFRLICGCGVNGETADMGRFSKMGGKLLNIEFFDDDNDDDDNDFNEFIDSNTFELDVSVRSNDDNSDSVVGDRYRLLSNNDGNDGDNDDFEFDKNLCEIGDVAVTIANAVDGIFVVDGTDKIEAFSASVVHFNDF